MAPWRVSDFHADDLDAAVRLWDNPAASSEAPAFGLSDLIAAVRSHEPAVALRPVHAPHADLARPPGSTQASPLPSPIREDQHQTR